MKVRAPKREAACLLALTRGDRTPPSPLHELDARAMIQLARSHQVSALCHWRLKNESASAWAALPGTVREDFRMGYLRHLLRNEVLADNIADVQVALSAKGISALVYKGPWLAFAAYPDPGTRPVDDIDLGVREDDLIGALEALEALGYRSFQRLPATPAEALGRAHYGSQLRFMAPGRRALELHFRMVNLGPPAAHESWVWEHARPLSVGKTTIQVPGPEAMLLHLLLHANQHGYSVLRLLWDIRFALEQLGEQIEESSFVARVSALRCRTSAYHSLLLARDLAAARPSESLLRALRPGPLRRKLFRSLWNLRDAQRLEVARPRAQMESPRLYLLEMGRIWDKARYIKGIAREAGGVVKMLRAARN